MNRDTATPQESSVANMDPLELLVGPITRARAKRFKEAISALVDQVWAESITSLLESLWISTSSYPCNLFQAHPAHIQFHKLDSSSTSSHSTQLQLMSLFSAQF
ncbi:hypothetical protein J1N35_008773 [Gossypium stocksii]|uniref:Uncharacterized protein n=1 Tax=Gossypium stocksii TaxID=47602 RepID=A0A9D4AGY0_9ROSI|nr:hypothetical protein J1N35_008773 [Gossypium stocksii]